MKQLLLSITALFAFALTSNAQLGPGPGGDSGLGGGTVLPDLIILSTTAPSTWSNITGTTFQVTVRNRHNAASTSASKIRVYYRLSNYPGYNGIYNRSFNVPAFAQWEIDKVITVNLGPVPVATYGPTTTLIAIEADGDYQIVEANELNNTYTP